MEAYGCVLDRICGSHHIYTHPRYEGIITIPKPHRGADVKPPFCWQALKAIQEMVSYGDE